MQSQRALYPSRSSSSILTSLSCRFPVLCRILVETRLLDTQVGIVVLSAGVANDVVGWVLLALSVALANSTSGLNAIYILLSCIGFMVVLLTGGRWFMSWLAEFTRSNETGPTILYMTVAIWILFASAFFTDIIGIHTIFGKHRIRRLHCSL